MELKGQQIKQEVTRKKKIESQAISRWNLAIRIQDNLKWQKLHESIVFIIFHIDMAKRTFLVLTKVLLIWILWNGKCQTLYFEIEEVVFNLLAADSLDWFMNHAAYKD